MNKKASLENLRDGHLQGLIIPDKVYAVPQLTWALIAVVLTLVLFGLWKWSQFRQQPKQKALRKLSLLQKNYSQQSSKMIVHELANTLRLGLNVPRLVLFQPKENQEYQEWKKFIAKLNLACYSTEKLKTSDVQHLMQKSRLWLLKS